MKSNSSQRPKSVAFCLNETTNSLKRVDDLKTADLSHMSDHKNIHPVPSLIPKEFSHDLITPIPLKKGISKLDTEENNWKTQVFPSDTPGTRDEVAMIGDWLNKVLVENKKETKDPLEMASNARHWFQIAFSELCRQISLECPERAQLLQSIWKRYQDLFSRVIQLHQEEKSYLLECHKSRTSHLKKELEECQSKLKAITQIYRDDQEKRTNAREREENRFANMRKKLDLQVKNRRNLLLQIQRLKQKLEHPTEEDKEISEHIQEEKTKQISQQALSDQVHSLLKKIEEEFPNLIELSSPLNDISQFIDHGIEPAFSTREQFPFISREMNSAYVPKIRSIEWLSSTLTYIYSNRLAELVKQNSQFPYQANRLHFSRFIYEYFLLGFGATQNAAQAFFDLVETAKSLKDYNPRFTVFLQFIDVCEPYLDSIILDFYCYCLGSVFVSNTAHQLIFPDEFGEEFRFFPLKGIFALEIAKKIFSSITESNVADEYAYELQKDLNLNHEIVSCDFILEKLIQVYIQEEARVKEQLYEQYEMDAAQYGGIVTFGQFQILALFSSRKLDTKSYSEILKDIFSRTITETIDFGSFIEGMHRFCLLVPFPFDRIDFTLDQRILRELHSKVVSGK